MAGGEGSHGTRAVVAALFANLGIAIAKFVGFVLTSSASMLAESVHSLADSGNQALLLLGGRRARKPATPEHPFGYGRERYFWAFVVAMILFSLGGMFAIYEGISKIRHPHELESANIAIGILVVAILLETLSFRTAVVEAHRVKQPGTGWLQFVRRSKSPELPVVLLEDLGALVGLILALAAVVTAEITGDAMWDGYGTLSIGILLVLIAIFLAIEMKGLLIGEAATETDQQAIAAAIEVEPSVTRLLHMRTEHIGPEELLVGAKIELVSGLRVEEVTEVVNRVETSVRRAVPSARIMYLEPDVFRTTNPGDGEPAPSGDHTEAPPAEPAAARPPTPPAPDETNVVEPPAPDRPAPPAPNDTNVADTPTPTGDAGDEAAEGGAPGADRGTDGGEAAAESGAESDAGSGDEQPAVAGGGGSGEPREPGEG
jgi:cation diffusion facilitator family transporter